MEIAVSSEVLVLMYQTKRRHIRESLTVNVKIIFVFLNRPG
jgi:hypothetical protein